MRIIGLLISIAVVLVAIGLASYAVNQTEKREFASGASAASRAGYRGPGASAHVRTSSS